MKERPRKNEPPQFLSGWKEIANYLGKGVRTVQRYERMFGLPVRRPAGKPWGSVLATKAELDAWVNATPIRDEFLLRNPQPEYLIQARDIRKGVSEMTLLKEQMFALRADLRKSVEALHNSVFSLQKELVKNGARDTVPARNDASLYSDDESSLLRKSETELLNAPVGYPKAS